MSTTTTEPRTGRTAHLAYSGYAIKLTLGEQGHKPDYDKYTYHITDPSGRTTPGRATPTYLERALSAALEDVLTLLAREGTE